MGADGDVAGLEELLAGNETRGSRRVRHAILSEAERARDPRYVPLLARLLLEDEDKSIRFAAAKQLGRLRTKSALMALIAARDEADGRVTSRVLESIGEIGDPEAVPALVDLTDNPDWLIRSSAAEALGSITGGSAVEGLGPLLDDPHRMVRQAAAIALEVIGGERAASLLEEAAGRARFIRRQVLLRAAEAARAEGRRPPSQPPS
jgi:HEAT repeat protein